MLSKLRSAYPRLCFSTKYINICKKIADGERLNLSLGSKLKNIARKFDSNDEETLEKFWELQKNFTGE